MSGIDQLILISGYSGTGKSASLRNIKNQEKWIYCCSESGKRLPMKNNFITFNLSDPKQVLDVFDQAIEAGDKCEGIIIDSITFLMDMFETQYVLRSSNTMKSWGDYGQFFKTILQEKVPKFGKPVIILAHTKDVFDEKEMAVKTYVPLKGALANQGCEAYFSTVVSCKKIPIKDLGEYDPNLLHISEDEELLGFKYVYQTRLTRETIGERIRSPMGMFNKNQTYTDNDAQLLLDHLNNYYGVN